MAPKRKTEAVPLPTETVDSPVPKKRQSSGTAKKRGREEKETQQSEATVQIEVSVPATISKKDSKKKKTEVVPAEIDVAEASPSPVKAKTPRKKVVKKEVPVEETKSEPKPEEEKAESKASSKKTPAKPRVRKPKEESKTPVVIAAPTETSSSSAVKEVVTVSLEKSTSFQPETNTLADEKEIVSIWNQCWTALFMCMTTIGPIFLVIILTSYALGKVNNSQLIGSIGVVYSYLFLVIMGAYCVAIIPFIIISRVFTSLVSAKTDKEGSGNISVRVLLLLTIGLLGHLVYKYK